MGMGGIETWLLRVLRNIDRKRFRMDFLVQTEETCAYDDEVRALGSRIIPCLQHHRPWSYRLNFKRVMQEKGPYDIIHSHVHHFSGYVLRLASRAGVPVRIAHSHTDTTLLQARAGVGRRAYLVLMKRWIRSHATVGLAASRRAAMALFGPGWEEDTRWQLFYYGIDLAPFRAGVDTRSIRAGLGIPPDALVIGHVGRFTEQKNHRFIIEIAAEVLKGEPETYLLLVGDGQLRPKIEETVACRGLSGRVIFAGLRGDIPHLMLGAMDVFLFPSRYEGLGLVSVEAQAAGLPVVVSDVVPEEIEVVKPLLRRLSLNQPPSVWAETLLSLRHTPPHLTPAQARAIMEKSPFNIRRGVERLSALYEDSYRNMREGTGA